MSSNFDDLTILPVKPPQNRKAIQHHPNLPDVNTGACVLDIASPKQGKSTRICNLLQNPAFYAQKFDAVYIFSSTMTNGDDTCRFLCEEFKETIYPEYNEKVLQQIIDFQDSIPKEQRPNIALIFDDFIAFQNLRKNSLAFRLASSYRHHNIKLLYYSTQYYKAVPVVVRQSINYAIISQNANNKEVEKMGEELGARYGDTKKFRELLHEATGKVPYSFLYLKLYDRPATAYRNFSEKIYEAPMVLANANGVEGEELPDGDTPDSDEDETL
jgi:hypothetical protein